MFVIESCQKIKYNALFMMIFISVSNFGDQPLQTFYDSSHKSRIFKELKYFVVLAWISLMLFNLRDSSHICLEIRNQSTVWSKVSGTNAYTQWTKTYVQKGIKRYKFKERKYWKSKLSQVLTHKPHILVLSYLCNYYCKLKSWN